MPPASVVLGRGTVLMPVSVSGSKPHTYPSAAVRPRRVKPKLTSISASVVPYALLDSELIFCAHKKQKWQGEFYS